MVVVVVLALNALVWAAVWLPQVPEHWLRTHRRGVRARPGRPD